MFQVGDRVMLSTPAAFRGMVGIVLVVPGEMVIDSLTGSPYQTPYYSVHFFDGDYADWPAAAAEMSWA